MLKRYNTDKNINEIGVDEAGRGPLLGRVYTAAVIWDNDIKIPENIKINDSKKLKPKEIIMAADFIMKNAKMYSIKYATEETIDNINILQATMKSIHECLDEVTTKINKDVFIIMDGTYFKKYKNIDYVCVKEGDSKYFAVACASILAKYSRDLYIDELCELNPDLIYKYGIDTNKGYGTMKHMEGLKKYCISKFHRKTFRPCSSYTDMPKPLIKLKKIYISESECELNECLL